MRIGERLALDRTLTEENMAFLRQLGVEGIMVNVGGPGKAGAEARVSRLRLGDYWETRHLLELRSQVERSGLELFGVGQVPPHRFDRIIRGLSGRDEQIENWCRSLRSLGEAGIGVLQYNWTINAGERHLNWRTSVETRGRGGALFASFDHGVEKAAPVSDIGPITEDEMWESLAYFLKAVIPVAEMAGVRMALHPADPQVPSLAGIARIVRSVQAYERVFAIAPSRANGVTFCQGCFAQMMDAKGVYETIRSFGARGKIAYVHLRAIEGTAEKFRETWWDEGEVDQAMAFEAYRQAGFDGHVVPDHAPRAAGDSEWGHRARAFAIGYIRGLLQATSPRR